MISGSDSTRLFDGYVEFEDQFEDDFGGLDTSKPMEREELESLTKRAILQQETEANYVSPEKRKEIESKAERIASIIYEWVYLAADSGDWEFKYDMNQVDQIYLVPTVHAVRRMFPGSYIKYSFSSKNRYIEVNWSSSSEC